MSDGSLPAQEAKSTVKSSAVAASETPRQRSLGCTFMLWLGAGLFLGAIATLVFLRWKYADPLPEISPADFYAARDRWQKNGPASYDIEVRVTGSRGALHRVEVREGQAIAAWINGRPHSQQRTYSTWSVPGMFGTIGRDIDHLERRAAGKADQSTPRLTLRAEFDAQTGYPARYRRIEWGSPVEVSWEVVKFEAK
jgi:hypothetical protein